MQMFDFILLFSFSGEVFLFMHKHMRIILYALIGIAAQSMCVYHIRIQTQKKWKKKSDLQNVVIVTQRMRKIQLEIKGEKRTSKLQQGYLVAVWNEIAWFSS